MLKQFQEKKLIDNDKIEFINEPNYVQQLYGKKLTGGAPQNVISDLKERIKILKRQKNLFYNFII